MPCCFVYQVESLNKKTFHIFNLYLVGCSDIIFVLFLFSYVAHQNYLESSTVTIFSPFSFLKSALHQQKIIANDINAAIIFLFVSKINKAVIVESFPRSFLADRLLLSKGTQHSVTFVLFGLSFVLKIIEPSSAAVKRDSTFSDIRAVWALFCS